MTRLAIIFSMLFATSAWAGEVDGNSFLTARAECIDSQTSLTAKTEIVSKYFDAELSENFYPDFFVKSIDERKFEWRTVRDAYLARTPGDGYWRSNLIIETTKARKAAEKYISEKFFTPNFLEQNVPEVYRVFQEGGWGSAQADRISLFDIWNSYVLSKEEEWNEAWFEAGLPDLAEYELNDSQMKKVPHDKFYLQDLAAFNEMKSHMSLLVGGSSNHLVSENENAVSSEQRACLE